MWEVSPACGRTRYFPRAGKYPKGAGGVQRVHVSWPPPDPPLLSNNAPLASQGRAQLGSLPSLGGPLSPSAQLIPPPAPGRRFIPRVVARSRYGRKTLLRYVPRRRCRAKGVPDAAPDWLRTSGQTEGMPDTDPVGRETRGSTPFAIRGAGGILRPFEGDIGGQGGIGGGRNPPLPPWPAEPRSNRKTCCKARYLLF